MIPCDLLTTNARVPCGRTAAFSVQGVGRRVYVCVNHLTGAVRATAGALRLAVTVCVLDPTAVVWTTPGIQV